MPKRKRKWIQKALGVKKRHAGLGPHHVKEVRVEAAHKGALHRALGVPLGQKIPSQMLKQAAKAPGTLGKQARLALTLSHFPHRSKRHRY
jgi:hypothetical protein